MAVYKRHKSKDYTVMSNYHLRDKRLSYRAKGLLSVIFSLPDSWDYSINGFVAMATEGRDAVRTTLKEIERNGYMSVTKQNSKESGKFEYRYDIYETPFHDSGGLPSTGKPGVDTSPQLNTKELSTENKKRELKRSGEIAEVFDYLNEKLGTHYHSSTKANSRLVGARLDEGHTVADCKKVIDIKCSEWMNDPKMVKYLRPKTLFNASNFESYLNQVVSTGAADVSQYQQYWNLHANGQ